jgi:hypothetical protein
MNSLHMKASIDRAALDAVLPGHSPDDFRRVACQVAHDVIGLWDAPKSVVFALRDPTEINLAVARNVMWALSRPRKTQQSAVAARAMQSAKHAVRRDHWYALVYSSHAALDAAALYGGKEREIEVYKKQKQRIEKLILKLKKLADEGLELGDVSL